jgi:hypothetical protein
LLKSYLFFPLLCFIKFIYCFQTTTDYVFALGLEEQLLFLKALKAGYVLTYSAHSSFALVLKTLLLELKGTLFTYRNAFDVALSLAKDTFGTTTRVFFFKSNILKVAFVTPRT